MSKLDDVFMPLTGFIESHAAALRDKEALVCGDRRVTWTELNGRMNRVANALIAAGVGKGDRVAFLMSNSVEAVELFFGILKSGACGVPLSPMLTSDQLGTLLSDSRPKMVFVGASSLELPQITGRDAWLPRGSWVGVGFESDGFRRYEDFLEGASDRNPHVDIRPTDHALIIYSSGTTGLPKGILHTHYSRVELAVGCSLEMRFNGLTRCVVSTGVHSTGTYLMMGPTFLMGGTIIVLDHFVPSGFLATMASEKISHTFLVPSQFLALLASPTLADTDLSNVRCMLSAGSPLRVETKQEILARMSPNLFELYGASEGIATMMKPEQWGGRIESVGQPMVGHSLRIIGDDDKEVPFGERGEIVGYSPCLMQGYYNKPDAVTAALWRDESGRSFFRSGDIGKMDENRFVTVVDRKKDMIISGGINVYPVDIEAILAGHEAIFDVTVIGIPHPKWDETPLALVIMKPGRTVTEEDLVTWANARLAKYQRISGVELREEFPRNALGKVLKKELRSKYWPEPKS